MKKKKNVVAAKKLPKSIAYRNRLGDSEGQRVSFRAVVGRKGRSVGFSGGIAIETLELKALYEMDKPNTLIADHLWVKAEDVVNSEVLDELLALKTEITKRIVITGIPYRYSEPLGGRGFKSYRPKYSIGDIEILETHPNIMEEQENANA